MANENQNQNQNQIKIEIPKEELQGRYANMAMIAHGPNDFFIDMILRGPNMPQARVQSRIIMAPQHAQELMFNGIAKATNRCRLQRYARAWATSSRKKKA